MKNNKGFADPASTTFGIILLVSTMLTTAGVVEVVGRNCQKNGANQLRQDRKRIWCQMQNKGKDYCQKEYPRL